MNAFSSTTAMIAIAIGCERREHLFRVQSILRLPIAVRWRFSHALS
jgi:hypothetical protein